MIARLIAGQFRRPTGLPGRVVGNVMAHGNKTEQHWTASLLDIQPSDHILEIGFGPGVAIECAAARVVKGQVTGIDYSETMVRSARKRNAAKIRAGRVDLMQGEVTDLPFPNATFDKAFTVHCIYFWDNPHAALRELRRVLKPGGLLAVTILPAENWPDERRPPRDVCTLYSSDKVVRLLSDAGFRETHVEISYQSRQFTGECVLGIK